MTVILLVLTRIAITLTLALTRKVHIKTDELENPRHSAVFEARFAVRRYRLANFEELHVHQTRKLHFVKCNCPTLRGCKMTCTLLRDQMYVSKQLSGELNKLACVVYGRNPTAICLVFMHQIRTYRLVQHFRLRVFNNC